MPPCAANHISLHPDTRTLAASKSDYPLCLCAPGKLFLGHLCLGKSFLSFQTSPKPICWMQPFLIPLNQMQCLFLLSTQSSFISSKLRLGG